MAGTQGGRRGRKSGDVAEPLGSLAGAASTSTPGPEACSACGGTTLTRVRIVLTDSTPAVFVSCHACEHKGWYEDGGDGTEFGLDWVTVHSAKKS
ncbi:hypothetical protein [Cellulomonas sp. P24]|uniref:hypothetical protein n=1 Tax=Cellulomonas sp. P24 TaxID=2885206 RepID=UPI00216B311D|nr:hypothetical protein [Cellulomonas sp. P24]MCR6491721.1 hypothetical protein [Cellulomonas sp. P24]